MAAIARAFVAVDPPAAVVASVDERVRAVQDARETSGLRWGRHGWHVTLRFLGRVEDAEAVSDALARAVRDVEPPTVRLGGAGAFPRPRRATVVWLGFAEGHDALRDLAEVVTDACAPFGFAPEDRRFQPHITLARARSAHDLRTLVDALGDEPVGEEWRVRSVVLLASETRHDGARHSEVSRLPLRGESV